ncbi:hypothetical protein QKT26_gp77 [Carcinus maenas nudivirus]|uniref:Uncharacterized protein n=1 Tax=Carcinus maenas nudivirus TaxID=2880837 RepID=A0AAE8Y2N1_9VIRU|nr:hypothetical protein QKT26_gp77 [Carcinus maenas nudivirus]UBZ25667.1 hypothetical protein CmNV_076 [Carcinus maenas nudivirus]
MIPDKDLVDFLSNLQVNDLINSSVVELLINTHIQNKSLFYWFNATLYENLSHNKKNIEFLNLFGNSHRTLFDLLAYIVIHLDTILDKFDARHMVKWILPLQEKKDTLQYQQNVNIINLSNSLCQANVSNINTDDIETLTNTLPLIKSHNALIIGRFLKLCPYKIYYPVDNEKYPIQRSLLYNIFLKLGVDMTDTSNDLTIRVHNFLESIKSEIDEKEFMNIFNSVLTDDGEVHKLLYQIGLSYIKIKRKIHAKYDYFMNEFENSIIPALIKKYPEYDEVSIQYKSIPLCKTPKFCDSDDIQPETVIDVFKNYPRFLKESVNINDLKFCPIQVNYIISLFPFYDNKVFFIENDIIKCEDIITNDEPQINMMKFKDIKNIISFNGDYDSFKNTIQLFNLSYEEVLGYIRSIYENRGFKCSVIIAELLNYHINTNFNTIGMYDLISKLSVTDQKFIDQERACQFEHYKVETPVIINTLLKNTPTNIITHNIKFDDLENILYKMDNYQTTEDKLIIASRTNYNCIPLIKYLRTNTNNKYTNNIYLLLLYSSAPQNLKNLIYKNIIPTHHQFPSNIETINENPQLLNFPPTLETLSLKNLLLMNNSKLKCLALLDYYKNTRDVDVLQYISSKIE